MSMPKPINTNVPIAGLEIGGKEETNTDLLAAIPHGAYSHQLNDRTWLGITVKARSA